MLKVVEGLEGIEIKLKTRQRFFRMTTKRVYLARAAPSRESRLLISAEEPNTVPEAVALKGGESSAPLEDGHKKRDNGKKGKKSRRGTEEETGRASNWSSPISCRTF